MKVFITVLALAVAVASATPLQQDPAKGSRITNGYTAYEGKAPYTVGLSFSSHDGDWWCGGTIIDHTWVLTAAQCTYPADAVTVYFGATWRTEAQYTHWVGKENFINHHNRDIALIRIPHVDFWSMVNKVELPSYSERDADYNSWWAVTCGWGYNYNEDFSLPEWLQCVDLQVMSHDECAEAYGSATVHSDIICVSTPEGKSTCGGDSGGPLVTHDGAKLIGVTNFHGPDCEAGSPAGFQRVASHLDWIREHTGISY